nr:hypothetical protein [Polymorphobacter sp.]
MRTGWGSETADCRFDVPPRFGIAERRLAGLALDAWSAGGRSRITGFDDNSIFVTDPAGFAVVTAIGASIAATFGLAVGVLLSGGDGLAAELAAACDLIALRPLPVPFEASLAAPGRDCVLVRGVALPLFDAGHETGTVQIVMSWREVLNRAATRRLRHELGAALRSSTLILAKIDPFSANTSA